MWMSGGAPDGLLPLGLLEFVRKRAGLTRQQLDTGVIARLNRVPVVDLEPHVPLPKSDVLGLAAQSSRLLGKQVDLVAGSGWTQPAVRHVLPHGPDRHAGGGQAGDPHQLVQVRLVVDAVLAARSPADRRDHADRLVVAERACRETGQRGRFLDRVAVLGGRRVHFINAKNFERLKSKVGSRGSEPPAPDGGSGAGGYGDESWTFQQGGRSTATEDTMRIGELAAATGTTTKTLRFYEESGLLAPAQRAANGYRDYGPEALSRLDFIRRGRVAGLTLAQVREVIDIRDAGDAPCDHVHRLLTARVADIDRQIADLHALRAALVRRRDHAETADPSTCAAETVCRYV